MNNLKSFFLICFLFLVFPVPLLGVENSSSTLLVEENNSNIFFQENLKIINNQVVLSKKLQTELTPEIIKSKQKLVNLSKRLSIDFTEELGIVYLHQGQQDWLVKFTYGGLILDFPDDIILSTDQIFILKKAFEQTPSIEIAGIQYPTTQFMRQLGPILHED